jgi:hypothetical protein
MWKPNESLDDYLGAPAAGDAPEPPRKVTVRRTGEFEILKPLTRSEVRARRPRFKSFRPTFPQPLWFRRFVAVGSGALVMIALVIVSAIIVGINDSAGGPEVVTDSKPVETLTQPEEPFTFDLSTPEAFELPTREVGIVRSTTTRKPTWPRIHRAADKPKPQLRPLPQPERPTFVPTTLVIYAEDGVIKTRIEPWVRSS